MTTIYKVRGPDGTVHEFAGPDGATPDQVTAVAARQFGGQQSAPQPPAPAPQSAEQAGEAAGAAESPLDAAQGQLMQQATLGGANYVRAGARWLGQNAASALGGEPADTWDQDLSFARGQSQGEAQAHPIAGTLGGVAGAVMGGGALGDAARAVGGALQSVPYLGRGLASLSTLRNGQPLLNTLKLAGTGAAAGAAAGAVSSATQGGSPTAGAVAGGVAGGVLGPVAPAVVRGIAAATQRIGSYVSESARNTATWDALSRYIKTPPAKLQQAAQDFYNSTGRWPTTAEILNRPDLQEVAPLVGRTQEGANTVANAADQATAARMQTAPVTVSSDPTAGMGPSPQQPGHYVSGMVVGPTATPAELETKQSNLMTERMVPVGNQPVVIGPEEASLLLHPDVAAIARRDRGTPTNPGLANKYRDMVGTLQFDEDSGEPVSGMYGGFTVNDMERLRQALRGKQSSAYQQGNAFESNAWGELKDAVSNIAAQAVPDYGDALGAYTDQSRFIDGFKHAYAGKSPSDANGTPLIDVLNSPEGKAGLETGARSRLAEQLGRSDASAVTVADQLRQNGELTQHVRDTMGAPEAQRLQRMGAAETQSAQNLATLTRRRAPTQQEEQMERLGRGVETVAALHGHTTTGFGVHAILRTVGQVLGVSGGVARKVAEELASNDPVRQQRVFGAMAQRGIARQQLVELARRTGLPASIAAGNAAGATLGANSNAQ